MTRLYTLAPRLPSSTSHVVRGTGGFTTYYSCEDLVLFRSDVTAYNIPIHYDLVIPDTEYPDVARLQFESLLLEKIAINYGLGIGDGFACTRLGDDASRLIQVSSTSFEDLPNTIPGSCVMLSPSNSNESCFSYAGAISMKSIGVLDTNDILDFIADSINTWTVTTTIDDSSSLLFINAFFLGTQLSSEIIGQSSMAMAIGPVDDAALETHTKPFTIVGAVLGGALILSFMGLIAVSCRRRGGGRTQKKDKETKRDLKKANSVEEGIGEIESSLRQAKSTDSIEVGLAELEACLKQKPDRCGFFCF